MSIPISVNRTPMTPSQYALEWTKSSSDHKRFSDYNWIASHLNEPAVILEIGCGSGNGTEALLKKGAKVISIEINRDLLLTAESHLKACGYQVEVTPLSQINNIDLSSEAQCYLIEADVFDSNLDSMFNIIAFDHVLFSFFGAAPAHAAAGLGVTVQSLDSEFARKYREKATLRAFQFKQLCAQTCQLVVVDRIHQEKGFSAKEVRNFYCDDLATRLGVSVGAIQIETRKNHAMQRPTTSAMQYINDGSFNQRPGTPLIVIAKI